MHPCDLKIAKTNTKNFISSQICDRKNGEYLQERLIFSSQAVTLSKVLLPILLLLNATTLSQKQRPMELQRSKRFSVWSHRFLPKTNRNREQNDHCTGYLAQLKLATIRILIALSRSNSLDSRSQTDAGCCKISAFFRY